MSLEQAIKELTAVISVLADHSRTMTQPDLPLPEVKKPKKEKKEKKVKETPVPAEEVEEIKQEVQETLKEYTIDEVRKKLQPIVQAEGPGKVQEVLAELGVQNLSSLAPKDYAKLLGMVAGG